MLHELFQCCFPFIYFSSFSFLLCMCIAYEKEVQLGKIKSAQPGGRFSR